MVLEEREDVNADESNYVLTSLGPVASGGRMNVRLGQLQSRRMEVEPCECDTIFRNLNKRSEVKKRLYVKLNFKMKQFSIRKTTKRLAVLLNRVLQ